MNRPTCICPPGSGARHIEGCPVLKSLETARREAREERQARKKIQEAWEADRKADRALFDEIVETLKPGAVMTYEEVLAAVRDMKAALSRIDQEMILSLEGGAARTDAPEAGDREAGLRFIVEHTRDGWSWWWAQRALGGDADPVRDEPDRCKATHRAQLLLHDRAEAAERDLAALREAAECVQNACDAQFGTVDEGDAVDVARRGLRAVLANTAPAAEAYRARVRRREEAIVRSTAEFLRGTVATEEDYRLIVEAVLDTSPQVIDRICRATADEIEGTR